MADLIDRAALKEVLTRYYNAPHVNNGSNVAAGMRIAIRGCLEMLDNETAVDAVEVEVLKAWLYEIAMNNADNYLGDACEEIISRLDGLRVFARERRTNATD